MSEVQFVLPAVSDDAVSSWLVVLTEQVCKVTGGDGIGGILGGQYGYGEDYENDVFVMRRFYWGDCTCGREQAESEWCDANEHSSDCYQSDLRATKLAAGFTIHPTLTCLLDAPEGLSYEARRDLENRIYREVCERHGQEYPSGCAIHCTCEYHREWKRLFGDGHAPTCELELANFHHKATGAEVRWYKYIGRDMQLTEADWPTIMRECFASVDPRYTLTESGYRAVMQQGAKLNGEVKAGEGSNGDE